MNKNLLLEDLKGHNGTAAREFAIAEIENLLNLMEATGFEEGDLADVDELEQQLFDYESTFEKIEDENDRLELENRELRQANLLLKRENTALGNYLDKLLLPAAPEVKASRFDSLNQEQNKSPKILSE